MICENQNSCNALKHRAKTTDIVAHASTNIKIQTVCRIVFSLTTAEIKAISL